MTLEEKLDLIKEMLGKEYSNESGKDIVFFIKRWFPQALEKAQLQKAALQHHENRRAEAALDAV